uniref:PPPDE domain-containing protein n=1 Tax=Spumella elongata TaxID=89044 RepID=A0A7S3HCQ2_9STRA|mmetsp:Transcript_136874/g.437897  ORF Transcript_136874/g.437897 Transcript_136874/m.437897 type:complete len:261 (-) Transcript_136874:319-1101(-)
MVFLDWCTVELPCGCERDGTPVRRMPVRPTHKVELAVTCRGMGGVAGYHTSVLVNGTEYYFNNGGIVAAPKMESHDRDCQVISMGYSQHSGPDMKKFLDTSFKASTYDILRKNCNSFSDCALYFLCGRRLSWGFRAAEQVGRVADDGLGLVQAIYGPSYGPNPRAEGFDHDGVIAAIRAHWGDDSDDSASGISDADGECSTTASELEYYPWMEIGCDSTAPIPSGIARGRSKSAASVMKITALQLSPPRKLMTTVRYSRA